MSKKLTKKLIDGGHIWWTDTSTGKAHVLCERCGLLKSTYTISVNGCDCKDIRP